jgi:hypothetical protein
MLAWLYIIQQLMFVTILFRLKIIYSIFSLFITFGIFIFKPDTYDLISYTKAVGSTDGLEPLFHYLISFFQVFTNDNRLVITFYQFFILSLSASIIFFFRNNKFLILVTIFSSVAVILATHNNLRQGTASLFMLIGIFFFLRGHKFISILSMILSCAVHISSIFFISIFSIIYFLYYFFLSRSLKKKYKSMNLIYIFSIFLGLLFAVLLYVFTDMLFYSNYQEMNLTIDNERTPLEIKTLALFLLLFTSEAFMKFQKIDYEIDFIRFIRLVFLFFIFFISFYKDFDEVGSRISYFYYIIELGLLCYLLNKNLYYPSCVIILFYSMAFNVWNILGGLDYLLW